MHTQNTRRSLLTAAGCALAMVVSCVGAATASAAPTPASAGDAPVRTCTINDLGATMRVDGGAAGHVYRTLTFKNLSPTVCKLDGHPGVSVVGHGDGTQIGASATRTRQATVPAVMLPNGIATATVDAVNIGDDGGPLGGTCHAVRADGWRIYPPDSTKAMYIPQRGLHACADPAVHWLTVSVVEPIK